MIDKVNEVKHNIVYAEYNDTIEDQLFINQEGQGVLYLLAACVLCDCFSSLRHSMLW